MAGTTAQRRAAIAASFPVQAAIIVTAAAILAGHPASQAKPPPIITIPAPAVASPESIAPPQLAPEIAVTVTAAGQVGLTDYPSPVESVLWVPSASGLVVTVTLTIPPDSELGRFQLGVTRGAWIGVPDNGTALLTSGALRPGQYTYTLHLSAADLPSVNGNYLVLTSQEDGDPALTAPLAEFIVGQAP